MSQQTVSIHNAALIWVCVLLDMMAEENKKWKYIVNAVQSFNMQEMDATVKASRKILCRKYIC